MTLPVVVVVSHVLLGLGLSEYDVPILVAGDSLGLIEEEAYELIHAAFVFHAHYVEKNVRGLNGLFPTSHAFLVEVTGSV